MAATVTEANDNVCDWCGDVVEEEGVYSELNCRRASCGRNVYHQNCVEEHLRKCKLQPDRLSGFPCPRGHGRQRRGDALASICEPCIGKIDSTHRKITKNKQKKAQVAQVFLPPPPGPKRKVPPPQQPMPPAKVVAKPAAAARAHVQAEAALAADRTKAQMLAMVASLRKEINGGVSSAREQGAGKQAAAVAAPAAIKVQPGAGAAARVGKQQQQVYIPGMEPVEPVPRPAPPLPAAPAKPFNLVEQKSSFPSLGQANAVASNNAAPSARPDKFFGESVHGGAINALNPDHTKGFVTDLARYNALLGVHAYGDGCNMEQANNWQATAIAEDSDGEVEEQDVSETESLQPPPEVLDPIYPTDQAVVQAGWLAGSDGRAADPQLVQHMYNEYGNKPRNEPGWQGLRDLEAKPNVEIVHSKRIQPAFVDDKLIGQKQAAEKAQIHYMDAQSPQATWSMPVPVPAYTPAAVKYNNVQLVQQAPPAASFVPWPHNPEACPVTQLHMAKVPEVEPGVDEELYEDLLSLCLA